MDLGTQPDSEHRREAGRVVKFLVVLPVVVLVGAQLFSFLYGVYDLKNRLRPELASAALQPDLEIRKKVASRLKGAGIECAEHDILVERRDGLVRAEVPYRYEVTLNLLGVRRSISSYTTRVVVESAVR